MTKLVKLTVIQTYSDNSTCSNNHVEIQIPSEAAEIIKKYWQQTHKLTKENNCHTKTCYLFED